LRTRRKILQIGIDSASWQIIGPLLAAGQLPNLALLVRRGTSGVLHSEVYSASPVVWTTMATGKLPEKHGIQDFFTPQRQLKAKRVWEILSDQGQVVGVYQHLVTWPPKPLNGFVVPGWLALDASTYPADLQFIKSFRGAEKGGRNSWQDYVRYGFRAFRHGMRPATLSRAASYVATRRSSWTALDYRYRAHLVDIDLSTDFFCHLLKQYQPSFAVTVYYHADAAGHFYWKYMDPEHFSRVTKDEIARYGHVIPEVYRALDTAVGRIIATAGEEYTVLVVSDHGMGPATHPSGYLYRPRVASLLEGLGYATDQEHALIGLDFYLYLKDQGPEAPSPQAIVALLNSMIVEETGEQVFEAKVLSGEYLVIRVKAARPELKTAVIKAPSGDKYAYKDLIATNEKTSGTHEPEGIFILAGSDVKADNKLEGAGLVDVAPTLLALMGMPVARDMDGRVLAQVLQADFLVQHPITYIDSYETGATEGDEEGQDLSLEERKILEEHLKALGYIE
jgi:hypothetical protein